jgi:hypothetical protein
MLVNQHGAALSHLVLYQFFGVSFSKISELVGKLIISDKNPGHNTMAQTKTQVTC